MLPKYSGITAQYCCFMIIRYNNNKYSQYENKKYLLVGNKWNKYCRMLYIKEGILINSDIIKLIKTNVSNVLPHVFHISIIGNRRQVFVVEISVNDKIV